MLEKSLNPGLESIGVRVPDSDFIRKIAHSSGSTLALTSANLSGKPSSVSIKDFEDLWEHCAFVYDGGVLPSARAGSTIVDLTKPGLYRILRPGSAMGETVVILEKHCSEKKPLNRKTPLASGSKHQNQPIGSRKRGEVRLWRTQRCRGTESQISIPWNKKRLLV
ncbi:hypothetical protein MLD38_009605 [Melastoma candidum]|uniref:Uncharacterized protein n=1 Tax=Melastoma candidum TaxID=119954 RepID=A0ACB9RZC7_9MYRT|nr:hypothetical protein MLD38_009605 [Melastoma candidum]